jgi:hypothetical protein
MDMDENPATVADGSNVVPFPLRGGRSLPTRNGDIAPYDFTDTELAILCRWYSAMRYAFPGVEGVMAVCHNERMAAVGLYGKTGIAPNCLISKYEADGRTQLIWATDFDPPKMVQSLDEITGPQIVAIAPPRNEASWLDVIGWMKVLADRTIAGVRSSDTLSPVRG